MQIISQFAPLPLAQPEKGTAVAMGFFDGIHIGHRAVIESAVQWAKEHDAAPAVFTFRLPVDNKMKGKRLLSSADKHALIASLGVEYYLTPDFEEIKGLTPEQFVLGIVRDCNARALVCGENFTFGAKAAGNPELLRTLPYKPFACSAIDALVHATESFLSPHRKTITSEMFSVKAMDMILKGFKLIDEKGQDARFEYLDEFVTASFFAGIAFLKAGCGPVHGMSFPLGGTYHVPHGESNYMLFGAILDYYDEHKPDGEIMKFKELVASILGCEAKNAIPELNALLQRILPLRPLRDCGFTEADFKAFPLSVEANQQRLMTNAYYPFDLASEEAIYRECY